MEKIINNDPVNHPSHYTRGKIECIDFITDQKLNFCRGNAIKYIVRAGLKNPETEIEDLQKAIFYINREIDDIKKQTNGYTIDDINTVPIGYPIGSKFISVPCAKQQGE